MKKSKLFHISIIILGIIFILIGAFHTNLWFDETYSVGLVEHSFKDIWLIGASDVHPILYYYLLKVVNLFFGSSVLAYRLFSTLGITILGILGYTHIRKDFNEKTGIIFSFLAFFLPIMSIYAQEIRMYSFLITFVTLMAIYAYRITKDTSNKNYIIFGIFSLASCYMHYYGLMTACFINLFLLIYLIIKKQNLKKIIIIALAQIVLYIPWLINLVKQIMTVSKGFWITFKFPDTLIEVITFPFSGKLNSSITIILTILIYLYLILIVRKKKDKGLLGIGIYLIIFIIAAIISIKSPLLVPRYTFSVIGLLIFSLSYYMAKGNKYVTLIICFGIFISSLFSNINFIKENYASSNKEAFNYLNEKIEKDDIIIYTDVIGGSIFIDKVDIKQYFYNIDNWNVEEAYRAFDYRMQIVDNLDILNSANRVWVIDSMDQRLYNILSNDYELLEEKTFNIKYHNLNYKIYLLRS